MYAFFCRQIMILSFHSKWFLCIKLHRINGSDEFCMTMTSFVVFPKCSGDVVVCFYVAKVRDNQLFPIIQSTRYGLTLHLDYENIVTRRYICFTFRPEYKKELQTLNRELQLHVLELADALVEKRSLYARRVEDISLIFNIQEFTPDELCDLIRLFLSPSFFV